MADACPPIDRRRCRTADEESPGTATACVTPLARATGMCSLAGMDRAGGDELRVEAADLVDVVGALAPWPDFGQAELGDGIEEAGIHVQALSVDALGARRRRYAGADGRDAAVAHDDRARFDDRAGERDDPRALDGVGLRRRLRGHAGGRDRPMRTMAVGQASARGVDRLERRVGARPCSWRRSSRHTLRRGRRSSSGSRGRRRDARSGPPGGRRSRLLQSSSSSVFRSASSDGARLQVLLAIEVDLAVDQRQLRRPRRRSADACRRRRGRHPCRPRSSRPACRSAAAWPG